MEHGLYFELVLDQQQPARDTAIDGRLVLQMEDLLESVSWGAEETLCREFLESPSKEVLRSRGWSGLGQNSEKTEAYPSQGNFFLEFIEFEQPMYLIINKYIQRQRLQTIPRVSYCQMCLNSFLWCSDIKSTLKQQNSQLLGNSWLLFHYINKGQDLFKFEQLRKRSFIDYNDPILKPYRQIFCEEVCSTILELIELKTEQLNNSRMDPSSTAQRILINIGSRANKVIAARGTRLNICEVADWASTPPKFIYQRQFTQPVDQIALCNSGRCLAVVVGLTLYFYDMEGSVNLLKAIQTEEKLRQIKFAPPTQQRKLSLGQPQKVEADNKQSILMAGLTNKGLALFNINGFQKLVLSDVKPTSILLYCFSTVKNKLYYLVGSAQSRICQSANIVELNKGSHHQLEGDQEYIRKMRPQQMTAGPNYLFIAGKYEQKKYIVAVFHLQPQLTKHKFNRIEAKQQFGMVHLCYFQAQLQKCLLATTYQPYSFKLYDLKDDKSNQSFGQVFSQAVLATEVVLAQSGELQVGVLYESKYVRRSKKLQEAVRATSPFSRKQSLDLEEISKLPDISGNLKNEFSFSPQKPKPVTQFHRKQTFGAVPVSPRASNDNKVRALIKQLKQLMDKYTKVLDNMEDNLLNIEEWERTVQKAQYLMTPNVNISQVESHTAEISRYRVLLDRILAQRNAKYKGSRSPFSTQPPKNQALQPIIHIIHNKYREYIRKLQLISKQITNKLEQANLCTIKLNFFKAETYNYQYITPIVLKVPPPDEHTLYI